MRPRRTWIGRSSTLQRFTRPERGAPPPQINPERKARRRKIYKAFLASAAWRRIRAEKLAASPSCELQHQGCLGAEQPTVHHTTYARFGGDELMQDLQRACAPCHRYHDALAGRHA